MTFSSPESSGDEDELRALPSGVVRKRKGWAGEEMEAARSLHHNVDEDDVKTGALRESFQNKEVGEGYQHRTVRRQNTGLATGPGKIVDMTRGGGGEESEKSKRKVRREVERTMTKFSEARLKPG